MAILYTGDNPRLEADLAGDQDAPCVVITHPHSLMGGNMYNNVVMAAFDLAIEKGFRAIRFNFRGAGGSSGRFDNGIGEISDIETIAGYVGNPSVIIGYSFGAWVASKYLKDNPVPSIFISPPNAMFDFPCLKGHDIDSIIGAQDQFLDLSTIFNLLDKERVKIINSADHFWFGKEDRLKAYLAEKLDPLRTSS